MRGLMDRRIKGRWRNTQENLFVLTAGLDYFKAYEAVEPDFTARMWLGAHFVGSAVYQGHSTRVEALEVPVARVGSETQRVSIAKEGAGRLYYRVGVTYAKADLRQPAIDRGFTVSRAYEAIEEGDVTRDPNGDWRVRAGALVRVRVTMKVPGQRYYVALVDPLPAGFEAQNPELATTAQAPVDEGQNGSRRYWVVHDNLRDERVEAYGNALRGGRYEYTYIARATTPGTFIAGGTLVEEMYHPETYGRGATELVHIAP